MKKILMIGFVFLILGLIGRIRFLDDNIMIGDELQTHINLVNREKTEIKDLRVKMYIPDLGIMIVGNGLDIKGKEKQGRFLFWDADKAGDYLVRIVATSDKAKDVKYRYVTVR